MASAHDGRCISPENDFQARCLPSIKASAAATPTVNGGVLEGTIDLAAAFGAAPTTVYVAAVLYGNADGGALVAGAQTPAGNGDGVVDPAEYHAFALPCR